VLTLGGWRAALAALGRDLPWTARRANLLIDGPSLTGRTGSILRVGGAILEITGECDPCSRMDEVVPGLAWVLEPDWRAGVTCRVLSGGRIATGDAVLLADATAACVRAPAARLAGSRRP
jgi:MOSC domain-containing protein YiiM